MEALIMFFYFVMGIALFIAVTVMLFQICMPIGVIWTAFWLYFGAKRLKAEE